MIPSLIYGTVRCTTRCRKMCSRTWYKFVFRSCCWLVYTFVHTLHKCGEPRWDIFWCHMWCLPPTPPPLCWSCSSHGGECVWTAAAEFCCGVQCKIDNTCVTLQVFVPVTPAFVWYVPHRYNCCRSTLSIHHCFSCVALGVVHLLPSQLWLISPLPS